jgi:hypothetical protein
VPTNEQAVQPEVPSGLPAQIPDTAPGAAVAQEQPDEPRVSRLSGKKIEPIRRKPEIQIEVVLKNEFHDAEGPIARRAVPREDAPADADDANLSVIERAVKRDDQAERAALAALQKELRATVLKDVKATAQAVAELKAEHGSFFARTSAALKSGELLTKAGVSSRERVNRLDRLVGDTMNLFGNSMVFQVEKVINELSVDELKPTMTSAGGGRIHDGFAIPARTRVERLAAGFRREGVIRDLNGNLEVVKVIVAELAERIKLNEAAAAKGGAVAKGTRIYTPQELDDMKAMSPSRASSGNRIDNGGPPGNEDDWDPLDPPSWPSRRRN